MKREHKRHHPHHHHLFYSWEQILEHYAIHVDIPIKFQYNDDREDKLIKAKDFSVPDPCWLKNPCLASNHKEFIFTFNYDETDGLAGIFRFLLPCDRNGNLSFVTIVDSKFKIFIDSDGDLGAASPSYKEDALKVELEIEKEEGIEDNWEIAELRGVYRDRFKQKPPEGSSYDDLLEKIVRSFTWTQDGLKVDLLDSHNGDKEKEPTRTHIFKFVPVPGLNAAEIDIRREWRTNLNVQRTDFVRDKSLDSFIDRYNNLAAKMWYNIIEKEGSFSDDQSKTKFIGKLINLCDWRLKPHIKEVFNLENN